MQLTLREGEKLKKILINNDKANVIIAVDNSKVFVYDNMVITVIDEKNKISVIVQPFKMILVEGERIEQQ